MTLAWCFDDEDERSLTLLDAAAETEFRVPSVWLYELTNGLAVAERRKRLTASDTERFLALLAGLNLVVEQAGVMELGGLLHLARQHTLAAYDAAYLALAQRLGCPLATVDADLVRAARRAGVQLAI